MARPLAEAHLEAATPALDRRRNLLNQSVARALAAAMSALLIATLVINHSADALTAEGTASSSSVASGTIAITDDDQGQSLVDLAAMAPGRPEEQCLTIVYEGTIVPVELALRTTAPGVLAAYLDTTIEVGTGGGFGDCAGFVPDHEVFSGTAHSLAQTGSLTLDRLVNSGDQRHYRIRFELRDTAEALGQTTTIDLVWEVTPV